ncbi:MAG: hypothetical protein FJ395_17545 [Verrucomicrobia bacterium]|nr:hypothetical protein [Verrucomicrobiota bacterium]
MRAGKVFITDYVGLSTRLETLALGFVISEHYGHEVCLDWPELDSFEVVGVRREGLGLTGRLGAVRIYECDDDQFAKLKDYRRIILRTHHGPAHLLEPAYVRTAQRVRLRVDLAQMIRDVFGRYAARPVVGVHVRRGDFALADEDVFDVKRAEWPATPTWWYEFVLGKIAAAHQDVAFFLSCTGNSDALAVLKKNFDIFELPTSSPYNYKGDGHYSKRHPMADLFALGCCRLIVASSCSTFSHYAAHALGRPSTCLIPPPQMVRANPQCGKVSLYGKGAAAWYRCCREGASLVMVNSTADLPEPVSAAVDWL